MVDMFMHRDPEQIKELEEQDDQDKVAAADDWGDAGMMPAGDMGMDMMTAGGPQPMDPTNPAAQMDPNASWADVGDYADAGNWNDPNVGMAPMNPAGVTPGGLDAGYGAYPDQGYVDPNAYNAPPVPAAPAAAQAYPTYEDVPDNAVFPQNDDREVW